MTAGDFFITCPAPKERIIQICPGEGSRIVALSNFGNIYSYKYGCWHQVESIDFDKLNGRESDE